MMKTKLKVSHEQLLYILSLINEKKLHIISDAITRLNLYQLYSTYELEKKIEKKMFTDKGFIPISINLVEAVTLHDILSSHCDDIRISKLFMNLQSFLPKIK